MLSARKGGEENTLVSPQQHRAMLAQQAAQRVLSPQTSKSNQGTPHNKFQNSARREYPSSNAAEYTPVKMEDMMSPSNQVFHVAFF